MDQKYRSTQIFFVSQRQSRQIQQLPALNQRSSMVSKSIFSTIIIYITRILFGYFSEVITLTLLDRIQSI